VTAVVLTLSLVVALAITGGVGYAASAAADGTSAVKKIVTGDSATASSSRSGTSRATLIAVVGGASSATAQYGNKVTICHHPTSNPATWHTIMVNQNAVNAHLKHGDTLGPCKPYPRTTLKVTLTPETKTVTSGTPFQMAVETKDTGPPSARASAVVTRTKAVKVTAWNVVTCVTLPRGITVAKKSGGYSANGKYCWRSTSIADGKSKSYKIWLRGDARLASQAKVVATAKGSNTNRSTADSSLLTILPGSVLGSGGFTG